MKVLVACEYSGRVRDAFIKEGHEAMSCDFLPTDQPTAGRSEAPPIKASLMPSQTNGVTIMTFNRTNIRTLRQNLQQQLDQSMDLKVTVGNAIYTPEEVTFKLTLRDMSAPDPVVQTWNSFAPVFGMNVDWMGKTFVSQNRNFQITGINPKATRYPILAKDLNTNRVFKFSSSDVRESMQ